MQILRDRNGKMIGQLTQLGENTRLANRNGKFMGYYNTKYDLTYDRNGKMVGRGNTLIMLLDNGPAK